MTSLRSLLSLSVTTLFLAGCTAEPPPSAPVVPADAPAPAAPSAPVNSGSSTKKVQPGPGAFQVE